MIKKYYQGDVSFDLVRKGNYGNKPVLKINQDENTETVPVNLLNSNTGYNYARI